MSSEAGLSELVGMVCIVKFIGAHCGEYLAVQAVAHPLLKVRGLDFALLTQPRWVNVSTIEAIHVCRPAGKMPTLEEDASKLAQLNEMYD